MTDQIIKHFKVCPRCAILYDMARDPDKAWFIVLPPHHPDCPKIAHLKPRVLKP